MQPTAPPRKIPADFLGKRHRLERGEAFQNWRRCVLCASAAGEENDLIEGVRRKSLTGDVRFTCREEVSDERRIPGGAGPAEIDYYSANILNANRSFDFPYEKLRKYHSDVLGGVIVCSTVFDGKICGIPIVRPDEGKTRLTDRKKAEFSGCSCLRTCRTEHLSFPNIRQRASGSCARAGRMAESGKNVSSFIAAAQRMPE